MEEKIKDFFREFFIGFPTPAKLDILAGGIAFLLYAAGILFPTLGFFGGMILAFRVFIRGLRKMTSD